MKLWTQQRALRAAVHRACRRHAPTPFTSDVFRPSDYTQSAFGVDAKRVQEKLHQSGTLGKLDVSIGLEPCGIEGFGPPEHLDFPVPKL